MAVWKTKIQKKDSKHSILNISNVKPFDFFSLATILIHICVHHALNRIPILLGNTPACVFTFKVNKKNKARVNNAVMVLLKKRSTLVLALTLSTSLLEPYLWNLKASWVLKYVQQ